MLQQSRICHLPFLFFTVGDLAQISETSLSLQCSTPIQMRGHDPIAHVCRARFLAHVASIFNECVIVIVIERERVTVSAGFLPETPGRSPRVLVFQKTNFPDVENRNWAESIATRTLGRKIIANVWIDVSALNGLKQRKRWRLRAVACAH